MTQPRTPVYSWPITMAPYGSSPFAFPDFRGITRLLILVNLAAYFVLLIGLRLVPNFDALASNMVLYPVQLLDGAFWQPFTYSFIHSGLYGTLMELLSLWFLAGFLENYHGARWVMGLYAASVLGTAVAVALLFLAGQAFSLAISPAPIAGCIGGVFGLLVAIGTLYGDMEFLLFFTIGIKARYMVAVYMLIALAMLFSSQRLYAFAQLGGALAGYLWARMAPRYGRRSRSASPTRAASEAWYGLRNRYYRWKRRRAAQKFEVYMKSQGRTVRFDGNGHRIDDEDPDDRKRWN